MPSVYTCICTCIYTRLIKGVCGGGREEVFFCFFVFGGDFFGCATGCTQAFGGGLVQTPLTVWGSQGLHKASVPEKNYAAPCYEAKKPKTAVQNLHIVFWGGHCAQDGLCTCIYILCIHVQYNGTLSHFAGTYEVKSASATPGV